MEHKNKQLIPLVLIITALKVQEREKKEMEGRREDGFSLVPK